MEEMMMEFTVGDVVHLPRCCTRSWDLDRALGEQKIRLPQLIRRINQGLTILNDGISVNIRIVGPERHRPRALIVFLHRERMGLSFEGDLDLGSVRSMEPEGHPPVFL